MDSKGNSVLVFLLVVAVGCCSKQFRFDYEYNQLAEGWLKFHEFPVTWNEARLQCHAEGAVLVSPLTDHLKNAIVSFVKAQVPNISVYRYYHIFSGVHATFANGVYSSIEGVPLRRLAITWSTREPDNRHGSENCLVMRIDSNGTMADTSCDTVQPYVCYKKDCDLTVTECGTTDTEYVLEPKTGSCYKFHGEGLVWSEAYRTCAAEGGYLAIINSVAEVEVVKSLKSKHADRIIALNRDFLFIGVHDTGVHHNFITIHGQTLTAAGYDKWMPGQPNNSTNSRVGDRGEFCGCLSNKGEFGDYLCNVPMIFLCEMTPNSLR